MYYSFWSSTSTLTFPYTMYSSTSSTDKYVQVPSTSIVLDPNPGYQK